MEVNCSEIFVFRRTMDGFCCSFNYRKTFANIEDVTNSNTKVNNTNSSKNSNSSFTPNAGLLMGLTIVVSANLDDYYYPLISAEGLSVRFSFDIREFPPNYASS